MEVHSLNLLNGIKAVSLISKVIDHNCKIVFNVCKVKGSGGFKNK